MRILQICPRIPFPPKDGGAIGIFNITKHLALRGHEIHMFTFVPRGATIEPGLDKFCDLSIIEHSTENRGIDAMKTLGSRMPYTMIKYRNEKMFKGLSEAVLEFDFDIVQVEHLHMAQYGLYLKDRHGLPIVLRAHNLETRMMQRLSKMVSNPVLSGYFGLQSKKMRRYESDTASQFDRCITITKEDEQELTAMCRQIKTTTIQAGIDIPAPSTITEKAPQTILFLASLDWLPNVEGFFWFFEKVLPFVVRKHPDTRVSIVGKGASPRLERIKHPNIDYVGFVDSVESHIQEACVCIVPLFVGSGMRIKILEMFAHSKCVVSTSVGCEGIDAANEKEVIIADEPETFAQSIVNVIEDRELRTQIGSNAYQLARRFDWKQVGEAFEKVHKDVILEKKSI